MIISTIRKYMLIGTAVSVMANVALFFALRHAIAEQEVIRGEARVEALAAANDAAARAAVRYEAAAVERELEFQRRLDEANSAVADARARALAATQRLSDFATEQQNDVESADWQATPLPGSVVTRLRGLLQ